MKKLITSLSVLSIAATGSNFFFSLPAQAVIGYSCPSNSSGSYLNAVNGSTYVPNASVVFTNLGSSTLGVIVNFSADVSLSPGAFITVSYGLDNSYFGEFVYGPGTFATYVGAEGAYETRTTTAVIPVPPGTHVIRPVWRVSGGQSAYLYNSCTTVIAN